MGLLEKNYLEFMKHNNKEFCQTLDLNRSESLLMYISRFNSNFFMSYKFSNVCFISDGVKKDSSSPKLWGTLVHKDNYLLYFTLKGFSENLEFSSIHFFPPIQEEYFADEKKGKSLVETIKGISHSIDDFFKELSQKS